MLLKNFTFNHLTSKTMRIMFDVQFLRANKDKNIIYLLSIINKKPFENRTARMKNVTVTIEEQ